MSDFKMLLKEADLTQASFSRLIEEYGGKAPHKTNMSRWANGATETPPLALAFLKLYIEMKKNEKQENTL